MVTYTVRDSKTGKIKRVVTSTKGGGYKTISKGSSGGSSSKGGSSSNSNKNVETLLLVQDILKKEKEKKVNNLINSKKNFRDLTKEGLTNAQAQSILAERESKQLSQQNNLDYTKFYKKLENPRVTVDYQSQLNAYKNTVNQNIRSMGNKPLSYNAPLSAYKNEQNKIIKLQKSLPIKINQQPQGQFYGVGVEPKITQTMRPKKIPLLFKQNNNNNNNNIYGISAPEKRNKYLEFEDYLNTEYKRIQDKNVDSRTNKEMFTIGLYGLGSAGIKTLRKIPVVIFDIIIATLRPDQVLKSLNKIATDKNTRDEILRQKNELSKGLQNGDTEAFSTLFSEILGYKIPISKIGQLSKISPKYVKIKDNQIKLRDSYIDKIKPARLYESLTGKKSNKLKQDPTLILKVQTVESGAKSLKDQVALGGKKVTAVNTSADQITSVIKRKTVIRKPITNEKKFPPKIKKILKDFDEGKKVSKKNFIFINTWLRKNVAPNITLLERSLYLDPEKGFRISRLKLKKEKKATLKDILQGKFKLFRSKPQVLIFENLEIDKIPKRLKKIKVKLEKEQKLTDKELSEFVQWQTTSGSGKAKPVGSPIFKGGKEFEVTIAPGDYIKRIKQIGFTYIGNTKITFVTAKIYNPPQKLLNKIKKVHEGKLSEKEVLKVEKELSKKLGRKVQIENKKNKSRRYNENTPILRPSGRALRTIKTVSRVTTRKSPPRKSPPRKSPPRKSPPRKSPPRKSPPRKSPPRKSPPRKSPPRKSPPRKSPSRKSPPRKSPPRKSPPRKSPPRKSPPKITQKEDKTKKTYLPAYKIILVKKNKKQNIIKTKLPLNRAKKEIQKAILQKKSGVKSAFLFREGKTELKDIDNVPLKGFRIARYQAQNKVGFVVRPIKLKK